MNRLELEKPPVMGQDGWIELFGEIEHPDDTPMMVFCADNSVQQGHAIEFRLGYLRGSKIIGYKIVED